MRVKNKIRYRELILQPITPKSIILDGFKNLLK